MSTRRYSYAHKRTHWTSYADPEARKGRSGRGPTGRLTAGGHMISPLDLSGLVLVTLGVTYQIYGWVTLWTSGPYGFRSVAMGAGACVAGIILLGGSWWIGRHATPGAHRKG